MENSGVVRPQISFKKDIDKLNVLRKNLDEGVNSYYPGYYALGPNLEELEESNRKEIQASKEEEEEKEIDKGNVIAFCARQQFTSNITETELSDLLNICHYMMEILKTLEIPPPVGGIPTAHQYFLQYFFGFRR